MSSLIFIHCYFKGLGREKERRKCKKKQSVDFSTFEPVSNTFLGMYVYTKNSKVKCVSL